jgi:serine/threonine protein kinase
VSAADAYPEEGRILETPDLRSFTFAELRTATRNFKPDTVLGEGGFGRVYKGWVDEKTMNPTRSGIGMVVAVKKLNPESVQGLQEWQVRLVRMNTPPRFSKLTTTLLLPSAR